MAPFDVKRVFKDHLIERYTNNFSEENLIGKFQFGKVYRGIHEGKQVTVKVWEDENASYKVLPGDNEIRLTEEVELLKYYTKYESHPNLPMLIGCTLFGKHLATVYTIKPLGTLHNFLMKDSLNWVQRIKVALGFASVVEFLHAADPPDLPYLIRNIDAAHIMLDEDHNPILFDFSMISGGILTDKRDLLNQYVDGCHGYIDPICARPGKWSEKSDVFSYGVLLLGLITKRIYTEEDAIDHKPFVYEWAMSKYKPQKSTVGCDKLKFSLVHQNFESDPFFHSDDGFKITMIAMQCVEYDPKKRPTMKQVVRYLQDLLVVKRNSATVGIDRLPHVDDACLHSIILSGISSLTLKKSDFELLLLHLSRRFRKDPCHGIYQIGELLSKQCRGYLLNCFDSRWQSNKDHKSPTSGQAGMISFGEGCDNIKAFSYEDLRMFTNGFSEETFIGTFQFGKVYHGMIEERKVMVKIWENSEMYIVHPGDNEDRLRDEIMLLHNSKLISHPNLVKLIGYCYERGHHLGAVYDLEPLDTVYNLALKGSFTWLQRIKVIFGFACLLKFLHAYDPTYAVPYLVRNIDAAHIVLDKDYVPKLFDFGLFSGGILNDRRFNKIQNVHGSYGYVCPDYACRGEWSEFCDVFSYGVVLLSLISKRIHTDEDRLAFRPNVSEWADSEYEVRMLTPGSGRSKFSFVHQSLELEPGFYSDDGPKITKLAMDCIKYYQYDRPTMKQVVKRLLKLRVARRHTHELGIEQMLNGAC